MPEDYGDESCYIARIEDIEEKMSPKSKLLTEYAQSKLG